MDEKDLKNLLSASEQSIITLAVLELMNKSPTIKELETLAEYQSIPKENGICFYSMRSPRKTKNYLDGGFEAQFPFFIIYRCSPKTTPQRIKKQEVLNVLGEWLEKADYPELSEGREIITIERTTTSYLAARDESGVEDYQCNFNLLYRKKGD